MRAIRPTTDEQKRIIKLSSSLPDVCDNAMKLVYEVLEQIGENVEDGWCYNKSFLGYEPVWRDHTYVLVLDSAEEYQVLRYFLVDASFSNNGWYYYREHHEEVAQRWISPDGKVTLLASDLWKVEGEYWRYHTGLKLRKEDADDYELPVYGAYAQSITIPFRNQHDLQAKYINSEGNDWEDDSLDFVRFALTPYGEWMMKVQPVLFGMCNACKHFLNKIQAYEREVKIATRYHYDLSNKDRLNMWTDYLRFLHDNDQYVKNGKVLEHKRYLQPSYVCPSNLKEAHDKWMKIDRRNQERKHELQLRKEAEQKLEAFLKHHKHFTDIYFNNGHLYAYSLNSPVEYWEEGDAMHHCVGKYWNNADSLVLSIRDQHGNRIATAEVSIADLDIIQIGGIDNLGNQLGEDRDYGILPEWNEIYDLIEANMSIVRERKAQRKAEKQLKKVA